jgi:Pentapeptide repeats (8 copies)
VNLRGAILSRADLGGACLSKADLREAKLRKAILTMAGLSGAKLSGADLTKAVLPHCDLRSITLVGTILKDADLTGCRIYGISAWGLKLDGAKQRNLVITPENEPEITVDDIEVAQFVYLLLHNEKSATSSTPPERKACSCWAASLKAGSRS